MKSRCFAFFALSTVFLFGGVPSASADTAFASCEVRKDGDTRKGASGPCTFSQRQGYIDLELKNGNRYSLSPSGRDGQYRDQKGNRVTRTITGGSTEEFKWEGGTKILLTFAGSSGSAPPASGGTSSDTPPALADLVGARASSGEMELNRRGYAWQGTEKTGADAYSYWREKENGQCVVVRTSNGRYASIAYAPDLDCKRAAASAGGGGGVSAERPDPYDTICGVIVGGQNYRYRCGATDFYSGGQKIRTELRYPDQTIQLTWRPGSRVGLQFEGMVPKEARYSTSEGETNFVFEDKTYFYYSDKGLAQMEWRNFRD
ncbi:MAG: hypothetical protein ACM3ML_20280 [Micromonosporaceae bacterium]